MGKIKKDWVYIYLLTFPNGKVYVGQTDNMLKRMSVHRTPNRKKMRLINYAIKKYKWENVVVKTLLVCSRKDANDYYEPSIIKLYKATDPTKGYNLHPGGRAGLLTARAKYEAYKEERCPILQYDAKTGWFEKWYPNQKFAAKATGIDSSHILANLKGRDRICKGKLFVYDKGSRAKRVFARSGKSDNCYYSYCIVNKKIKKFGTSRELALYLNPMGNIDHTQHKICSVANTYHTRYGHYILRTAINKIIDVEEKFLELKNLPKKLSSYNTGCKKPVIGIEISTKKILEFDSVSTAAKYIGTAAKHLSECLNKSGSKNYKGYTWSFKI